MYVLYGAINTSIRIECLTECTSGFGKAVYPLRTEAEQLQGKGDDRKACILAKSTNSKLCYSMA